MAKGFTFFTGRLRADYRDDEGEGSTIETEAGQKAIQLRLKNVVVDEIRQISKADFLKFEPSVIETGADSPRLRHRITGATWIGDTVHENVTVFRVFHLDAGTYTAIEHLATAQAGQLDVRIAGAVKDDQLDGFVQENDGQPEGADNTEDAQNLPLQSLFRRFGVPANWKGSGPASHHNTKARGRGDRLADDDNENYNNRNRWIPGIGPYGCGCLTALLLLALLLALLALLFNGRCDCEAERRAEQRKRAEQNVIPLTDTVKIIRVDSFRITDTLYLVDTTRERVVTNDTSRYTVQAGELEFTLRWQTYDDLDIGISLPNSRNMISFSNPSAGGGRLDVDMNRGAERSAFPIEHVTFETPDPGDYRVYVWRYAKRTPRSTPYTLEVRYRNQTQIITGTIETTAKDVSGPIDIGPAVFIQTVTQ